VTDSEGCHLFGIPHRMGSDFVGTSIIPTIDPVT